MRQKALALTIVAAASAAGMLGWRSAESASAPDIEVLPSPAAPGSAEPFVVAGGNGRVFLSWMEPAPDSAFALRFASFDGSRWSEPSSIRSSRDFFVNWADFASLEVFGNN